MHLVLVDTYTCVLLSVVPALVDIVVLWMVFQIITVYLFNFSAVADIDAVANIYIAVNVDIAVIDTGITAPPKQ